MDILALCRKMVILFFCMATGFAAAKGGAMDLQSNKKLSALVVNIANPMQILASALTGEHLLSNGETLRLAGLIVLIYLGLIALSFPAAKVLRVKGSEAGLYRFMFIFSNTGFLGYPIVESLLGYQATFYVTLDGKLQEKQAEIDRLQEKTAFFDQNAVCVNDDGSMLYHRYGCARLEPDQCRIYSRKMRARMISRNSVISCVHEGESRYTSSSLDSGR